MPDPLFFLAHFAIQAGAWLKASGLDHLALLLALLAFAVERAKAAQYLHHQIAKIKDERLRQAADSALDRVDQAAQKATSAAIEALLARLPAVAGVPLKNVTDSLEKAAAASFAVSPTTACLADAARAYQPGANAGAGSAGAAAAAPSDVAGLAARTSAEIARAESALHS